MSALPWAWRRTAVGGRAAGIGVTLEPVKLRADGSLLALSRAGNHQQQGPMLCLLDAVARREGWEWVEAKQRWSHSSVPAAFMARRLRGPKGEVVPFAGCSRRSGTGWGQSR